MRNFRGKQEGGRQEPVKRSSNVVHHYHQTNTHTCNTQHAKTQILAHGASGKTAKNHHKQSSWRTLCPPYNNRNDRDQDNRAIKISHWVPKKSVVPHTICRMGKGIHGEFLHTPVLNVGRHIERLQICQEEGKKAETPACRECKESFPCT